jgi:16S rRNA (uracil1498-N3)-methyltransferase
VTEEEMSPEGVTFSRPHAHYLLRVLRLKPGDLVEVLDGRTRTQVKLFSPAEGLLCGTIVESRPVVGPAEAGVTLAFACVRPGPMEDILQHGTEVGVRRFVPILTLRSMRRPREVKDRWASILSAAAAQSGQCRVPELKPPVSLGDFLSSLDDQPVRLLLSLGSDALPILACLENRDSGEIVILAGPEGGFTASEESEAVRAGFARVSVGTGILRTETAAVVAAATVGMWRQWQALREG